ncbi:cytochrome c oxidase assembly protein [Hydrogenophaga sp. IBVHS1]|jgi:hypothetical protein|uniref:cytochrome c oxidase assembly protein n=1 Tax=unclassified Hydrogenophaga TaxID=2610897 RepID=UPI000A2D6C27|nr:cytochrome c oxidase assembly protein [Hydrogenophaga sp. IBVHS1]OSZ75485.1 hypothetical protein CAP37_08795 [Hydrogenophaga sp. IBVHS1]HVL10558.1 hypothetical protein [Burkholderiaceae bacterium]
MSAARKPVVIRFAAGVALLAVSMLPPLRQTLESSMSLHMLVQYPALMLAGALMTMALPPALALRLSTWNAVGISGLTATALILAVLMIPRVLDLALLDPRVEGAKVAALLFAGAVLWPSWRAAGLMVQAFFLGSVVPMTIVIATLYQDSPVRLCNAYRIDDQQQLGLGLLWIAGTVTVGWFVHAGRHLLLADAGE